MSVYFSAEPEDDPVRISIVMIQTARGGGWREVSAVNDYFKVEGVWKLRNYGYVRSGVFPVQLREGNLVRSIDKEKTIYKPLQHWVSEIVNSNPESVLWTLYGVHSE